VVITIQIQLENLKRKVQLILNYFYSCLQVFVLTVLFYKMLQVTEKHQQMLCKCLYVSDQTFLG
jgi:hypothetical protein